VGPEGRRQTREHILIQSGCRRDHRTAWRVTVLGFALLAGLAGVAQAFGQPDFTVESESGPFQIRSYPALTIAAVQESGSRSSAVSRGFRTLAHYIFGHNSQRREFAMTAPVLQKPPTRQELRQSGSAAGSSTDWEIQFILPAGTAPRDLPLAEDQRIEFRQAAAARFAVVRFSGFWSDANFAAHTARLMTFLKERQLIPRGPAVYAYYDPPWTPWFWRRNEVQIQIAESVAP
jgi:hypothetical protein